MIKEQKTCVVPPLQKKYPVGAKQRFLIRRPRVRISVKKRSIFEQSNAKNAIWAKSVQIEVEKGFCFLLIFFFWETATQFQ